jgi:hypothetical protein
MKNGTQPARFNEYMSKAALPALNKVHPGPKIVMEAVVAPHSPQVAVILGFRSIEEFWSVRAKLNADKELDKASEAWQAGPEPPFEQMTSALLEATDYSPEIVALDPPPVSPRLFELRVYHSPTYSQLRALHERFAGPEIQLFHKHGVHPILYTSTVVGPQIPNLTYVIPFADLAAREKAWAAFGATPTARAKALSKALPGGTRYCAMPSFPPPCALKPRPWSATCTSSLASLPRTLTVAAFTPACLTTLRSSSRTSLKTSTRVSSGTATSLSCTSSDTFSRSWLRT